MIAHVIVTVVFILTMMPIEGFPINSPAPPENADLEDYPAVLSVYDPDLGGMNCDSDCNIMASGHEWTEADYGKIAACHPDLLWKYVELPGVGRVQCLDTGTEIVVQYSDHYQKEVLYFDVLWDLEYEKCEQGESGCLWLWAQTECDDKPVYQWVRITGAPDWHWWLVPWSRSS